MGFVEDCCAQFNRYSYIGEHKNSLLHQRFRYSFDL